MTNEQYSGIRPPTQPEPLRITYNVGGSMHMRAASEMTESNATKISQNIAELKQTIVKLNSMFIGERYSR